MLGTVRWFDDKKGFGFITSDDGEENIFFHFSEINCDGFKTLNQKDIVSFELLKSEKGLQAVKVEKKELVTT